MREVDACPYLISWPEHTARLIYLLALNVNNARFVAHDGFWMKQALSRQFKHRQTILDREMPNKPAEASSERLRLFYAWWLTILSITSNAGRVKQKNWKSSSGKIILSGFPKVSKINNDFIPLIFRDSDEADNKGKEEQNFSFCVFFWGGLAIEPWKPRSCSVAGPNWALRDWAPFTETWQESENSFGRGRYITAPGTSFSEEVYEEPFSVSSILTVTFDESHGKGSLTPIVNTM